MTGHVPGNGLPYRGTAGGLLPAPQHWGEGSRVFAERAGHGHVPPGGAWLHGQVPREAASGASVRAEEATCIAHSRPGRTCLQCAADTTLVRRLVPDLS